jgi:hypothetical protein
VGHASANHVGVVDRVHRSAVTRFRRAYVRGGARLD